MSLEPGALVSLVGRPGRTYQVVNLDGFSDSVWVRRWPLSTHRNPTFSVTAAEVVAPLADAA